MKIQIAPNCNPPPPKHVYDECASFDLVINSATGGFTLMHRHQPIYRGGADRILATDKRISIWFSNECDAEKMKRAMVEAELGWGHDLRGADSFLKRHFNAVYIRRSLAIIYATV